MKRPAVFLDRDGTLIEEVNFLSRVEDIIIFPFAAEALRLLRSSGYLIVVITNQSGVGRGMFREAVVDAIHNELDQRLSGGIDAFYFCPHLPNEGCECRKPGVGMFEEAIEDLNITREGSWMVGDKSIDVEAGRNTGISTILVRTGYGDLHADSLTVHPEFIEADLLSAAKRIVGRIA
jgi:D-glycero-D-manno-heptose 1,7-bisphosphate phosphatase